MLGNWALFKGTNEELAKLSHSPFSRRGFDDYSPDE
jgi:hypothetical protein